MCESLDVPARSQRRSWLAGAVLGVATLASAARGDDAPARLYLANDDHTDYMWTADADAYAGVFLDLLDFHLALADQTAASAPPYRNRFNADGSYWLWEYEHRKTPAEFARLMARVKDGTINAPLNTLVSCYGGQPAEAALRGMYYAGRLERRYDVRFPTALAMENQTLPLGLASLFAGAGAKYSWRGVCGCASKLPFKVLSARPHEIYWYEGHDGQRVLMKWYSLGAKALGTYTEAGDPWGVLKVIDGAAFQSRYVDPQTKVPYRVTGLFGFGGDDLARKTGTPPPTTLPAVPGLQAVVASPYADHFPTIAQQMTTPERQVIVSNEADFFEDFERTHGATLPASRVTYGNEWDLYSASMSETSAQAKRATEKLRSAELLATLVSLKFPAFTAPHAAARDRAFNALGMYWEHDWTADGPVSRGQRAAWQQLQATTIDYYVDSLQSEAIVRLGGMIGRPEKANRFFVVNPLGWPRTDAADFAYAGPADVHVRDVTDGRDVPSQIVALPEGRRLRILAADVPAAGYKVYEILPGPGEALLDDAATADVADGSLANAAVRIKLDRDGAIRSLVDPKVGELAAEIDGLRVNDFAAKDDAGEPLKIVNRGPVSVTLRARSEAGVPHATSVTLYRDSPRVDVRNEIEANFATVRHWAFSFALDAPAVHTEEVGAINLNKRKADGGDYADTHARYDYVTVNHFADVVSGDRSRGVTISNPDLAFAKLGRSTATALDVATPQVNLLAGGQVDGSWLGIQAQNGASRFLQRFALRAHAGYDAAAAMRVALEHQNPFVTGPVISKVAEGAYPAANYSLLEATNPNVLVWAIKPAEEGIDRGIVVRQWNVSDAAATTTVRLTPPAASATRVTHVETDVTPAPLGGRSELEATFAPQEMRTYRFALAPAATRPAAAATTRVSVP